MVDFTVAAGRRLSTSGLALQSGRPDAITRLAFQGEGVSFLSLSASPCLYCLASTSLSNRPPPTVSEGRKKARHHFCASFMSCPFSL